MVDFRALKIALSKYLIFMHPKFLHGMRANSNKHQATKLRKNDTIPSCVLEVEKFMEGRGHRSINLVFVLGMIASPFQKSKIKNEAQVYL